MQEEKLYESLKKISDSINNSYISPFMNEYGDINISTTVGLYAQQADRGDYAHLFCQRKLMDKYPFVYLTAPRAMGKFKQLLNVARGVDKARMYLDYVESIDDINEKKRHNVDSVKTFIKINDLVYKKCISELLAMLEDLDITPKTLTKHVYNMPDSDFKILNKIYSSKDIQALRSEIYNDETHKFIDKVLGNCSDIVHDQQLQKGSYLHLIYGKSVSNGSRILMDNITLTRNVDSLLPNIINKAPVRKRLRISISEIKDLYADDIDDEIVLNYKTMPFDTYDNYLHKLIKIVTFLDVYNTGKCVYFKTDKYNFDLIREKCDQIYKMFVSGKILTFEGGND